MVHVNTVAKVYSFFRHLKTNGLGFRPVCLSDKLLCYAFFDFFLLSRIIMLAHIWILCILGGFFKNFNLHFEEGI